MSGGDLSVEFLGQKYPVGEVESPRGASAEPAGEVDGSRVGEVAERPIGVVDLSAELVVGPFAGGVAVVLAEADETSDRDRRCGRVVGDEVSGQDAGEPGCKPNPDDERWAGLRGLGELVGVLA